MAVTAPSNDLTWCPALRARSTSCRAVRASPLLSLSGVALLIRSVCGASTCCQAFCRSGPGARRLDGRVTPRLGVDAPRLIDGWESLGLAFPEHVQTGIITSGGSALTAALPAREESGAV
ncbi:hypothetical protein T492DRAFT_1139036 [Pavlovales sp. CCMP2436]|nr:hypothetical protein T492DRAFT_1139036 [Pavlovales sp. CCMP2436]